MVVKAFVVLREGHLPSDSLAQEIQDHVKRTIAPYKYPHGSTSWPHCPKPHPARSFDATCASWNELAQPANEAPSASICCRQVDLLRR